VARWASGGSDAAPTGTVVGQLKLHAIDSKYLKARRTIRVWLPAGYDVNDHERYPVLYMQDGQNCFDRATSGFGQEWQIDETLTRLIAQHLLPPLIVVGIDNGLAKRIDEYTYTADADHGGGQGAAYSRFMVDEVMPFVERTYRTASGPDHTFIGGSSLGGLISLDIAWHHPGKFGGAVAMSPALRWAGEALTREVEQDPNGLAGARVWLDMGTRENYSASAESAADQNQKLLDAAKRLDAALTKHRVEHRFTIDDKHPQHNEAAWAARFPDAISYILRRRD
jgi:predicted alpha/beta superfamily hydrolase